MIKINKRPSVVRVRPGEPQDDSYDITIAAGLFPMVPEFIKNIEREKGFKIHRLAIITDSKLRRLYGKRLASWFGGDAPILHFPQGEASKSREMKNMLEDKLVKAGLGRDSGIVAFGGGVVGDLAGFVAATYFRGVPYFQVPTTIVSQVDSSIGGKTAIDLPAGKNLIGSFYQPKGVFIDVDLLDTLPEDDFVNGFAEVIKHAMIRDKGFFQFLEKNVAAILSRDKSKLIETLKRSSAVKVGVVSEDIKEGNLRKILNFGHTVGHAVETVSDYSLHHGRCVAIGMAAEALIAQRAGYLTAEESGRLVSLILRFGLPVTLPEKIDIKKVIRAMGVDKKNERGRGRFVLPSAIGRMKTISGNYALAVNMSRVMSALKDLA